MLRRKHCSAKTQALKTSVPHGSTKVEWLESSGTQWILPNISTKDLSVEIDYSSLRITSNNNYQKTFGYWGDNEQYQILETANYEPYPNIIRATIFGQTIPFGDRNNSLEIQDRTKYKFDANRGEVSLNNIIYANDIDFSKGSENNPIGIFATLENNWDGIRYANPANMRLYSFKSWKLKLLQTHLIPSLDKTGTPCMFDLVSRKNFYNVGTGQFRYHPISNIVPSNYTRIDYLESTGTQWIDTLSYLDDNVEVQTELQYTNLLYNTDQVNWFYGNFSSRTKYILWGLYNNDNRGWAITGDLSRGFYIPSVCTLFDRFIVEHTKDFIKLNGVACDFWDTQNLGGAAITKTLYLFARHHKDGYAQFPVSGKMWYFKVLYNGTVSNNYVPCLDPTGTPCMYDTATQTPYYNAGTGDFLYPSPTSSTTYSMRRPLAEYAKMTDTGVRRLYHVPVGYEGSIEEYASENGFKLLNETESPNEEGKHYSFKWVETDDTLTTEWFEIDPPQEEFIEENLDNPIE